MTLKLIGAGPSPFVRKVRVALAEKGMAYEHDPMVPFGVSDEYRRMHPLGKIPTLRDGDKVIPDSSAILVYLEAVQPEPALYPEEPYARARAVWLEEYADAGLVDAT
ncbi:MAG: glutathione S-transferase family protein, partial [Myxococcota bacterium]|nr:glutathione S-transferase family protein [Myxococcota bacterium]